MLVNYPLYGGETIDKANVLERGQILRLLDPLTLDLDLRFTNMEVYGVDKKLSELGDSELNELLDADMFNPIIDCSRSEHFPNEWFGNWFEDSVLNDKLMSDMEQSPHVQVEHSYSLALSESGPNSPLDENFKIDVYKDLESECFPSIPMDTIHLPQYIPLTIKKEVSSLKTPCMVKSQMPQPMIVVSNPANSRQQRLVLPKVNIKVEPTDVCDQNITFGLPPTPPSSSNSDSEGCQSPTHSIPSSPPSCSPVKQSSRSFSHHGVRSTGTPPAISNQNTQSTGVLVLTEEEKRTLLAEGYPIPSKLPLTKAEEKSLKKIRRKIKNKISAQESRRKKKEYLDALEKRVESFSSENTDLKKKMENLESNNKSLLAQLQKLQAIAGKITKSYRTTSTQTCLMVLVLCFAIVLGPWSPSFLNTDKHSIINSYTTSLDNSIKLSLSQLDQPRLDPYTTPNKRSRMLLAFTEDGEDLMPYGPPRNQHSPAIQKKNQMVSNPKPSNLLPCQPLMESNMVALSTGVESNTLLVDNLMVQQITNNIVTTEPRINATE